MPDAEWYPDPERPGWLRYWDGARWTEHRSPVPPPTPAPPARRPIDAERAAAPRARIALVVYGGGMAASLVGITALAVRFDDIVDDVLDAFDATDPDAGGGFEAIDGVGFTVVNGAMQLLNIIVLGAGIVFVMWLHHASATARERGYPQQWSHYWAWLGFLVPFMNFFVPYQIARDTLPVGHPGHRFARGWWAAYLVGGMSTMVVMGAGLLGADPLAWAVAAGGVAAWLVFAVAGRRLVDAVADDHGSQHVDGARSTSEVTA